MSYGLYIHLPFCRRKCPYCGFVSFPHEEERMETYARAAAHELEMRRQGVFSGNPETVYIGGGTPSIFPAEYIAKILADIHISDTMECTVEANPESLSESWLSGLRTLGINRLSIGMQSLNDHLLRELGRMHTVSQAIQAVEMAREAGFRNISADLMFGIPGQTPQIWADTLERISGLGIHHISAYSLGIEEDTPFFERSKRGGMKIPDPEITAEMYAILSEILTRRGYRRYEISNYAIPGFECRHNRAYWDFSRYLGIGVSVHTFDGRIRSWNTAELGIYMERCVSGNLPPGDNEVIDERTRALEWIMLSLRTAEGFAMDEYIARFPVNAKKMRQKIGFLVKEGLLEYTGNINVRLTVGGIMIADEIMSEIALDI